MGISESGLDFLLEEASARPFGGAVLTLGRQDVWLTERQVRQQAAAKGVTLAAGVPIELSNKPQLAQRGCLSDACLLRLLGFDRVTTLDASDYEGAELVFDLNDEALPQGHAGRYDAVLDVGVMEHVFDLAQGLRNVFDLLAVGGRFTAFHPVLHTIDASFYLFSPTLFADWYRVNHWELCALKVYTFPHGTYQNAPPRHVFDYQPGMWDDTATGLDGCYWDVFSVGRKLADSTGTRKPTQRIYAEQWELSKAAPNVERLFRSNATLRWKLAHTLGDDEKLAILKAMTDDQRFALLAQLSDAQKIGLINQLHAVTCRPPEAPPPPEAVPPAEGASEVATEVTESTEGVAEGLTDASEPTPPA